MLPLLLFLLFSFNPTLHLQIDSSNPTCLKSFDRNHEAVLKTPFGELEGINITVRDPETGDAVHAAVALGVPYAYSVIGEFRFRPSEPAPRVRRLLASHFGRRCIPLGSYPGEFNSNEDCLFLNIFKPMLTGAESKSKIPVLFVIHGGLFNFGGSDDFFIDGLLSNWITRKIAVVTVNYRLGAFGFFAGNATTSSEILGLSDVQLALRWIHKSADLLELDATQITILGIDAGAVLAEAVAFQAEFRTKIAGLILMGGSVFAPWAEAPKVEVTSIVLAEQLRNDSGLDDIDDPWYIMKMTPAEKIFSVTGKNNLTRASKNFMEFAPNFENVEDIKLGIYNRDFEKSIPAVFLSTPNEGLIRSTVFTQSYFQAFGKSTAVSKNDRNSFACDEFHEFIDSYLASTLPAIADDIKEFYNCSDDGISAFEKYNQFLGDFWFSVPAALDAMIHAAYEHPTWFINISTEDSEFEEVSGFGDMPSPLLANTMLFSKYNTFTPATSQEFLRVQKKLLDTLADFVKTSSIKAEALDPQSWIGGSFSSWILSPESLKSANIMNETVQFYKNLTNFGAPKLFSNLWGSEVFEALERIRYL